MLPESLLIFEWVWADIWVSHWKSIKLVERPLHSYVTDWDGFADKIPSTLLLYGHVVAEQGFADGMLALYTDF